MKEHNMSFVLAEPTCQLVDWMGDDPAVIEGAKVSFAREGIYDSISRQPRPVNTKSEKRLIRYLAMHDHWTPIAGVVLKLRLTMPIAVRTQALRSNVGNTFNEVSRRYVSDGCRFFMPSVIRLAAEDKKQGSAGDHPNSDHMRDVMLEATKHAHETYSYLIENGVCPEQARFILPQNLMTSVYMTGSLEFFCRLLSLRLPDDAQKEIRDIMPLIAALCERIAPVTFRRRLDAYRVKAEALRYVDSRFKAITDDKPDSDVIALQDSFDSFVDGIISNMIRDS